MTDIDWSKAPEGAQYYSASDDVFYTFYRHIKESTYEMFYCGGTRWVLRVGTPEEHCTSIPRPPQAWNGEGLPPVGVVCMAGCEQVVIVAHHCNGIHAIYAESESDGLLYYGEPNEFRPIRTTEQIAADEREAAVAEMLGLFGYTASRDTYLMQALYDAGYRKPC